MSHGMVGTRITMVVMAQPTKLVQGAVYQAARFGGASQIQRRPHWAAQGSKLRSVMTARRLVRPMVQKPGAGSLRHGRSSSRATPRELRMIAIQSKGIGQGRRL